MFGFFQPRYLRDAKELLSAASRIYRYKKDLLNQQEKELFKNLLANLHIALKSKDRNQIEHAGKALEAVAIHHAPPQRSAWLRENCEVLLVAVILAAAIRAYFLQPFKIPTGSMQPTLYGIVSEKTDAPFPNPVIRFFEFFILGKNYIEVQSKSDEAVVALKEKTYLNFFTFTEISCEQNTYNVFAPKTQLEQDFGVRPGRFYRAGETIARGVIRSGDQLLVDKMSYNFIFPKAGDIFVFKTTGIKRIEETLPQGIDSQHYIKRLAGMPGETLRISPPILYVDGQPASGNGFSKVMSCQNGYQGYTNGLARGYKFQYLGDPNMEFRVPPKSYFALGDNSPNSSDSRYWGPLPARNVTGRALLVYWPISPRWGWIIGR
ncbi:MAG: signal peptidase I [Chthoniobacterales bacterium]|nr:signal peptidase I [Chthoniobacterales bacterium]